MQQFDRGAGADAQCGDAHPRPGNGRKPFLLRPPVLARAGYPQPEPVAIERNAALGVRCGDRRVIDPKKQPVPVLPARLAFAGRKLDQFHGMPIRIAEVDGTNSAGTRVPHRQRLRPGGDRRGPGPQRDPIGPVDIGHHDCEMLEPEIVAARSGRDRPAALLDQRDPFAAETQARGGAVIGMITLPYKADRLEESRGAFELRHRNSDVAHRLDGRSAERDRRGQQQSAKKGENAGAAHRSLLPAPSRSSR